MKFVVSDMEKMTFPDEIFDCVISNGAFCMTPSKEKAFKEIYRVLKPGGRMSICTSVIKLELKEGVKWPLCMRMFIHVQQIVPLCQKIGFKKINIDKSNSLMQYDIDSESKDKGNWDVKDHDR